jgi:hypothetical protein
LSAQESSKESFGGALIAARLNQDVDHIAVLIHGPPEIVLLPIDSNQDFIQMPGVAGATLAPIQISGVAGTGLLTPDSNRFIRDDLKQNGLSVGGRHGVRTHDPHVANVVLSQLS